MTTRPNIHRIRVGEIDEAPIYEVIEGLIGERPAALIPRETVAPRFVWEALLAGGRSIYVKAEHDTGGDDALLLEAWAAQRARDRGVPVPTTLGLDSSRRMFPGPVLLQEKARGNPIAPVWRDPQDDEIALPAERARDVWRSLGRYLRRLHDERISGYGRLDDARYAGTGEVRGAWDSWSDAMLTPALDAITFMRAEHCLSDEHLSAAERALDRLGDTFADFNDPRLLHGDVGAKHVFVDPETYEITAIIDWGDREAGDPANDIAGVALWEDDARMEWTLEGYEPDDGPAFQRRIIAFIVADGLRYAARRFRQGRREAADSIVSWMLPQITKALSHN